MTGTNLTGICGNLSVDLIAEKELIAIQHFILRVAEQKGIDGEALWKRHFYESFGNDPSSLICADEKIYYDFMKHAYNETYELCMNELGQVRHG